MKASPNVPQINPLQIAELGGEIWKHGDYDKALSLLTQAWNLAEDLGDKFALTTSLYHLGELAYVRSFFMREGDLQKAMDYHQQSLAMREKIADQQGTVLSLSRVGVLHERLKEFDQAMDCYERAIELSKEVEFPQGMIRPYTHIGAHHRRNGDLQKALTYYKKALRISEQVEDQENIIFGLCNVGWATYRLQRDFGLALSCFNRALGIAERLDFRFAIGRAHHALAELFLEEGDSAQALIHFEKLYQLADSVNYKRLSEMAEQRIAEIKEQKG